MPIVVDGHELQGDLAELQALGEEESDLLDKSVAAEPESRGMRRSMIGAGWMLVMAFGGLIFAGKAGNA